MKQNRTVSYPKGLEQYLFRIYSSLVIPFEHEQISTFIFNVPHLHPFSKCLFTLDSAWKTDQYFAVLIKPECWYSFLLTKDKSQPVSQDETLHYKAVIMAQSPSPLYNAALKHTYFFFSLNKQVKFCNGINIASPL